MIDKNGTEIKAGDLIKRCGYVEYADGKRFKVSKNTWVVSKIEDDRVFYESRFPNSRGVEVVEDVEIKLPKDNGSFLVVGNGYELLPEYQPTGMVLAGSVEDKYRVLKPVVERGWDVGDVVSIVGKVSTETLENGWLEKVGKDTPNKHVLVVVDAIKLNNKTQNG